MKNFWNEFKEFALKGSVLDLAIGIIIGAAFGNIVNSLVNDILMPPLGLLLNDVDFKDLFINLSDTDYSSLTAAQEAGAPTINYGLFINNVISFLIVALVIFLIVKQINRLRSKPEAMPPSMKECPYCFSNIPIKATRCPECTSQLEAGKATAEAAAQ